ncbi:hypothetical protein CICLE_v10033255mg [Citrus x clementina]|uniref:Uncharacterized protein n=1 Tax=Citrus clementina TaxID=85681 RepID=V4TGV3_CITCL|nr:hypothetical protein CICLE_v10033255mg [Citrus x clementina]
MLMELYPDFNPHKYSRNVHSSLLGKEENYIHSILIEEENTPKYICEGSNRYPPTWRAKPSGCHFDIEIRKSQ